MQVRSSICYCRPRTARRGKSRCAERRWEPRACLVLAAGSGAAPFCRCAAVAAQRSAVHRRRHRLVQPASVYRRRAEYGGRCPLSRRGPAGGGSDTWGRARLSRRRRVAGSRFGRAREPRGVEERGTVGRWPAIRPSASRRQFTPRSGRVPSAGRNVLHRPLDQPRRGPIRRRRSMAKHLPSFARRIARPGHRAALSNLAVVVAAVREQV